LRMDKRTGSSHEFLLERMRLPFAQSAEFTV
jgi:hypothetical protein